MLNHQDQLVELIRELETRNHIFATDPMLIDEQLKSENMSVKEKLYQRAKRIDNQKILSKMLSKLDYKIRLIILVLTVIWLITGFVGTFALLQAQIVNFFYLLICLLGWHTLSWGFWIINSIKNGENQLSVFTNFLNPSQFIRNRDDVTQSAIALYQRQIEHIGVRWYLSKIGHQLWLASLLGMLLALITLFSVRNVNFAWESTLFSADSVRMIVHKLAWLPDLLGFATPSDAQIIQSEQLANNAHKNGYEWAVLLMSSLFLYAIVPRFCLWIWCISAIKKDKVSLDFQLPYYQKLFNYWSKQIVDKDDFVEEKNTSIFTQAQLIDGNKVAVLLEYPYFDNAWYEKILHKYQQHFDNVTDFEVVDDRKQIQQLIDYLQKNAVQVLLGVSANCLPDRGTLRKIEKIAQYAEQGLIICLLGNKNELNNENKPNSNKRMTEWRNLLTEKNIAFINMLE